MKYVSSYLLHALRNFQHKLKPRAPDSWNTIIYLYQLIYIEIL
jgi:hypothetical protein